MAGLAGDDPTDIFAEQHLRDATGGSVDAWKQGIQQQNQAADAYLKSIQSPQGSAAYQQQMLGLGRAQNQMAGQALSRGANPANERAALYAGANLQSQALGQAGALRAQEEQQARQAQIQARQFGAQGYGQQAAFNAANQQALWALRQQDKALDKGNDTSSVLGNTFGGVASTVGGMAMISDEQLKRDIRDAGLDHGAIREQAAQARETGRAPLSAAGGERRTTPLSSNDSWADRLGREPDRGGRAEALSRSLGDGRLQERWLWPDRLGREPEVGGRAAAIERSLGDGSLPRDSATFYDRLEAPDRVSEIARGLNGPPPWRNVAVQTPQIDRPRFSLEDAYGRDVVSDENSKQMIRSLQGQLDDERAKNGGAADDMSHLDPYTRMYPWPEGSPDEAPMNQQRAQMRTPIVEAMPGESHESIMNRMGQAASLSQQNENARLGGSLHPHQWNGQANPPPVPSESMTPWEKMMADRQKKREDDARMGAGFNMLSGGLRQALGAQ